MAVTKLSNLSVTSGRTYNNLLAGNPTFIPSSFESIATATGTGSSPTITFSSIPSTFKHLQIRYIGRNTFAGSAMDPLRINFNSDTATNYAHHYLRGDGSVASAGGSATQTRIQVFDIIPENSFSAGIMGAGVIDILDYASTSKFKTVRVFAGFDTNGGGYQAVQVSSGLWQSTSAITSIDLNPSGINWTTNTTFALYGIKEA